jgi:hypothetical protein
MILAWWGDTLNDILLSHYGYDFDAMNDAEKLTEVSNENIERVKQLEISTMGIGLATQGFHYLCSIFSIPSSRIFDSLPD